MRKISLIFYIIFTVRFLASQVPGFVESESIPSFDLEVYQPKTDTPYVFVPSGFAASEVKNAKTPDSLRDHVVYQIVLVYSAYHKSENFDQEKLNQERWNKLLRLYPELFNNAATSYQSVRQTSARTDSTAKKLQHGFFIYYRKPAGKEEREKEVSGLEDFLINLGMDVKDTAEIPVSEKESAETVSFKDVTAKTPEDKKKDIFWKPKFTKDKKACRKPYYGTGQKDLEDFFNSTVKVPTRLKKKKKHIDTDITFRLHFNGSLVSAKIICSNKKMSLPISAALNKMDRWNPAIKNGMTVKSDVKVKLRYRDGKFMLLADPLVARQLQKCDCCTPDSLLFPDMEAPELVEIADYYPVFSPEDSIIRKVTERNKDMRDLLVAVDLTGSMSPYIMQVITLMEELAISKDPEVKCFSLFNDGDSKDDSKKEIGNTGGVYIVHGDITLRTLGKTVLRAMKRGSGGDTPENNIEAVIKGLEECPECRDVIMVADNFATPRDGSLLSMVKTPMHWIICGGDEWLNAEYLDLVRINKGYLHTLNYDLKDLHLVREGETIRVGEQEFVLKNGKFKRQKFQS